MVPFGSEYNDTLAPAEDDGYTPVIVLPTAFPFFGMAETDLYVSNSTNKIL